MKQRLFLAIPLPETLKQAIEAYKTSILLPSARWVKKDNLHITISFFGNIEEEFIPVMVEHLELVTQKAKRFTLTLAQAEFAPRKRPRMLWLRYHEQEAFWSLVTAVETRIGEIADNSAFERKKTVAHITLARLHNTEAELPDLPQQPQLEQLRVTSITLYSSTLTPTGPIYTILKEFPL
jgi:RNA 2',3'-cyclic 3'-phosphodiesterase